MLALAPAASANDDPTPADRVGPGVYLAEASSIDFKGKPGGERPDAAASEREPRIVGGSPVDISQVPWQAAITRSPAAFQGNAHERQFCGGSLVAPNVVITAAHCVFSQDGTAPETPPSELAVVTGRTVLSSSQGQELLVQDYFVFVDGQGNFLYNPRNNAYDVAIFQLAQPSTTGVPIRLPGPDERELWNLGRSAIVSGWGATRFEGSTSDQLLATEVYMTPESTCKLLYGSGFASATSICAGVFVGGRDTCQGDSGGPIAVPTAQGGFRLAGDVQSGIECANPRTPGIYGRFGTDPLQTDLRTAVAQLSGTDIVGSGATPPTTITLEQGEDLGWTHAEASFNKCRKCRSFQSNRCQVNGTGVQCRETLTSRLRRGRKKTCKQTILFTADTGTIVSTPVGGKQCSTRN